MFMEQCIACPIDMDFHYETVYYLDNVFPIEARRKGDRINEKSLSESVLL